MTLAENYLSGINTYLYSYYANIYVCAPYYQWFSDPYKFRFQVGTTTTIQLDWICPTNYAG